VEYDRHKVRAYVEFRGPDEDGGDAITVALFSYRTAERLSKKQLHEEIVRKARYLLKRSAVATRKGAFMPDLSVAVDRHGIVVSEPGTEFSVAYRREGSVLVADDLMRKTDPSAEQMVFLVQAWKVAFAKAQSLGWLY
jgi:hypothetical protein